MTKRSVVPVVPVIPHRRRSRRPALAATFAAGIALVVLPATAAYAFTPLFPRATEVIAPPDIASPPTSNLYSTACTSGGNCVAGGLYIDNAGHTQALLAKESHGIWSHGFKLQLPKSAIASPGAAVNGLACPRAGSCIAVGSFSHDAANDSQGFIARQVNGKWTRGFVPRLPANARPTHVIGFLTSVACTGTGFCAAVGGYIDKAGRFQTMALTKSAGQRWRRAVEILAPKGAAADPSTDMHAVTCPSAGHCVAVGSYVIPGANFREQAMGALLAGGRWHRAVRIIPPANAKPNFRAVLNGISCRSGTCTGVGWYNLTATRVRAMWVKESGGRFRTGIQIRATPADAGAVPDARLLSVSCPHTGPCVAVGFYTNTSNHQTALYMRLASGKWTASTLLPPLNADTAGFQSSVGAGVACTGTEHCTAVGYYHDTAGRFRSLATSSN